MRAKDIMSAPAITVGPSITLKEAAGILVRAKMNSLPVVNDEGELVGIISEADIVSLETGPDPRSHMISLLPRERAIPRTVAEVMTKQVIAVQGQADVAELARLMIKHRIKSIPVVQGNRVTGIVARRDILTLLARSDADIRIDLEDLLDDEILMLGRFRAEVSGGLVTLRGPRDPESRRLAELLARSIPGAMQVRFEDSVLAAASSN